jgi:hypothetical protein
VQPRSHSAAALWRLEHQPRSAGFAATPVQPSVPGIIHALGALFIFLSLTAAILTLSLFHRGRGERWMAFYCLSSGLLLPVVFVWAMSHPTLTGPALQVAVLIGWLVPSFTAARLLRAPEQRWAGPATHKQD